MEAGVWRDRWPVLVVGLLTLLGFLLRLSGMGQSVFGDEVLLLARVDDRGFGQMLHQVREIESTPPFHFILAWAGTKVADPVTGIRLPSLILGTATIPLTYLAGRRAVGRDAGLVGAALVALSPFAIFYGTEGRAYATLAFLAAASLFFLLRAVERGGVWAWAAWAVTACLILYTHYTGIYVLLGEALWVMVLHPERRRGLLLAGAGVALAYLPWLPSFFLQSDDNASNRIDSFAPLSGQSFLRDWLKSIDGHPFIPLRDLPGRTAELVFCVAAGLALAVAVAGRVRARAAGASRPNGVSLVAVAALATPVGLLVYSLLAKSVVLPRNMSASIPAAALTLGWALTAAGPRLRVGLTVVALAALCVGTVAVTRDDNRRPPFEDAARFIDAHARPGDAVIDFFYNPASRVSGRELVVNLKGRYHLYRAGSDDDAAWRRARESGGRVFLVVPQVGVLRGVPRRSGPGNRFPLRDYRIYPGFIPLGVFEYRI